MALILLGTTVSTATFLYIFAPAANYLRLVDVPDQQRKLHTGNVPLTGGLSLYLSLVVIFYISGYAAVSLSPSRDFWPVTTACLAMLVMMHAVDDIVELRAETRLFLDAMLAFFICTYAVVKLTTLGNLIGMGEVTLGRFSVIMTVFCFVAASNAFNMVDGIDSLCSGLGIVALLTLATLIGLGGAPVQPQLVECMLVVVVALTVAYIANQGLLGPRMRIFLGDSGARLIAFMVAIAVILAAQHKLIHPVMAYFPIAVPVCDCLVLMATRMLHGRSPVSGDRLHLHHLLQDVGLRPRQTRRAILSIAVMFSLAGIGFQLIGPPDWVISLFIVVSFGSYMGFRFWLMHLAAVRHADVRDHATGIVNPADSSDTHAVTQKVS